MLELRCPACGSNQIYTRKKDHTRRCKTCGYEWAVKDDYFVDFDDQDDDDEPPLNFDDADDKDNTLEPESSNDDLSNE